MNQKNGKNSLGLDSCFEDLENPIDLFKKWFSKAKDSEINDPNAVAIATAFGSLISLSLALENHFLNKSIGFSRSSKQESIPSEFLPFF